MLRKYGWVLGLASVVATGLVAIHVASCVSGDASSTCPDYCTNITATCVGDNTQYKDEPMCERMCAVMEAGTPGQATADTVACRQLNVRSAKDAPDGSAQQHSACVTGGPAASCCSGTVQQCQCEAFCNLDLALCTGSNAAYQSLSDCTTACATWGGSFDGPLFGSTGNTLQCRTYHLDLSQTGQPADLVTHCKHTAAISGVCAGGTADAGSDAADATAD